MFDPRLIPSMIDAALERALARLVEWVRRTYFKKSDHAIASAGVGDAYRPVATGAAGTIDPTLLGGAPTFTGLFVDGVSRVRQAGATRYRSDHKVLSGIAILDAYDDTGAAYIPVWIDGQYLQYRINGSTIALQISTEGAVFRGPVVETAEGYDNVRIGMLGGIPYVILEDAGSTQWELINSAGVLGFRIPGATRMSLTAAGALSLDSTIKTALNVTWDMGAYTAGAPAATGYVTVKVAGVTYKLLTST